MAYKDAYGDWHSGEDPNIAKWQSQGLNIGNFSTKTYKTPGSAGKAPSFMDSGYAGTPDKYRYANVYNSPQGQWEESDGGWVGAGGQKVGDLAGYLKMKGQQQSGADFSGYQNQLQGLLNDPSKIQQTAGYQFAVDQGNKAINRSAAAKGMLGSGNVLAELAKYGQGMASQDYGNQVNRLSSLMQGAQNFGLQSGYYEPPQNYNVPGATMIKPSTW